MSSVLHSGADAEHRAILISPRQAMIGTFLGGPIACIYYLRMNYLAIGDRVSARKVIVSGALFLLVWNIVIALGVTVPGPASIVFSFILKVTPLLLVFFARDRVQKQWKSLPVQYDFYPNWSVAVSGVVCLLLSIACLLPAVVIAVVIALATSGFR